MTTIRKYLDERGMEVSASQGVACQEIEVDASGTVVSERIYQTEPERSQFVPEALQKLSK